MNNEQIKKQLKKSPRLKRWILNALISPRKVRPRWWIRLLQPFFIQKGKRTIIYCTVRKDIAPFHPVKIGTASVIESYTTLNNLSGYLHIGSRCHIGIANTLIGPISIGNAVITAQNVTISGLNHNYQQPETPIRDQGVTTRQVTIGDDSWIGANTVILPGVTIGKHCIIGAGSVVHQSVPAYSLAVGNPSRVIKKFDNTTQKWIKN